ncbi:MAG: hypothetical protein RR446_09280 [Lachnospiraceae bacterium]
MMPETAKGNPKAQLLELLEEYADIHDELEDTMQSFEILSADISMAMDDIRDELDRLQEHFTKCSQKLKRL